ncbi:MAG: GGDEF domain-containing protein [Acidimicrobiia bacterium]|nr:GGDEF domain-containing protein [Acidimicrobiia bacterium]
MKDRCLASSIAAGIAALICGMIDSVIDSSPLGIVAGVLGFSAAIGAAAIAARQVNAQDHLVALTEERDGLRRELDALAAIFGDEAAHARDATLALAPPLNMEKSVDAASGLLDQQFFKVMVQQRVSAARRQLQPLTVILFDIDGLDGASREECDAAISALGETVTRTLRESDAACRVGSKMAAAILEDTAEAGAVWAAERIRGTLNQTAQGVTITVSAGIACYPTHALSAPELIDRAGRALDTARSQGRDRLEIANSD